MTTDERSRYLAEFASGTLRVLCACDLLNEGWDCPDVEVLMMARPTLSKVIYMQQLGRGTRKAPGKESLLVFDFIDNASKYNQSLNLNRLLGQRKYRPGGLLLASDAQLRAEQEALDRGEIPSTILPIELWTRDFQEIDVFNWQDAVSGMISSSELELHLACAEGRVRSAAERGVVAPDHVLTLGDRKYYYFQKDRDDEIREKLDLPRVDDESIRDLFLDFVQQMDMASSYKPVMLLAILDHLDDRGRASVADVVRDFHAFYLERHLRGLLVEKPSARMSRADELSEDEVRTLMLSMPFEKFERRKYMKYDKDVAFIRIDGRIWRRLKLKDRTEIRGMCSRAIDEYYNRITDKLGEK